MKENLILNDKRTGHGSRKEINPDHLQTGGRKETGKETRRAGIETGQNIGRARGARQGRTLVGVIAERRGRDPNAGKIDEKNCPSEQETRSLGDQKEEKARRRSKWGRKIA